MALTVSTMPSRQSAARNRYMSDSVHTMSPAQMVLRLYDKLVSELERAEPSMATGDLYTANEALVRAQAIILELRSSLDTKVWAGAAQLASLYDFFVREIIQANVSRDASRVVTTRKLIEPLRDAWYAAAAQLAAQA